MTLMPLSLKAHTALLAEYNHTADPESRTRYQMIFIRIEKNLSPRQIAPLVHRSHNGVVRAVDQRRDLTGGLSAVPRKKGPGPKPKVTTVWEQELLAVIENDPHEYGVNSANWTTQLLADYLACKTGITVDPETVRRSLHPRVVSYEQSPSSSSFAGRNVSDAHCQTHDEPGAHRHYRPGL